MVGSCLLGWLIGIVLGLASNSMYEGVAVIKIGRVGSVGTTMPEQTNHGGNIRDFGVFKYYGLERDFRLIMTIEELYRQLAVKHNHRHARRGARHPAQLPEAGQDAGAAAA